MDSEKQQILFALKAVSDGKLSQEQLANAIEIWHASNDASLSEVIASSSGSADHHADCYATQIPVRSAYTPPSELVQDDYQTQLPSAHSSDNQLDSKKSSAQVVKEISQSNNPGSSVGPGVASSYDTFADSGSGAPSTPSLDVPFGADVGKRYEIIRAHAKGGLGEVFVARDRELQRDVALKEIQLQHSSDIECRTRFILEARVTGGLEHPGIVPVYSLGKHDDGRLYYAMRFIEGESFKEAVDRSFDAIDQENPAKIAGRPAVAFRKLLNRFTHVCNAVEYAHSRGVLHRDIKPANIMLGMYDETLLVDWGLAKIKEEDRSVPEDHSLFGEQMLKLHSSGDSSATQMGALVGTPAYMSPEQAHGNNERVGTSCDIYSLGATLYYLLTGKPPFERNKVAIILNKVRAGEFPRPSDVLATVPKGLEAICLKAMALEPKDRYSHASDIAEDIERWLADEPISILRETPSEKLGRWIRRNRSLAASILVGLTLVAVISSIASVGINHARTEEKKMKDEAIAANLQAVESQKRLTSSLEQSETLSREKSIEAAKAQRLSTFLLSLFKASDPVAQGKGVFIGKPKAVNLSARDLLDRGAAKLKEDRELDDVPLTRAAIQGTIGDVYRQLAVFDPAEQLLKESLALRLQHLPKDSPELAESYHDLGAVYHEQGDYKQGYVHYTKALEIRHKLPGDAGQLAYASTLHNLGWMIANEGDAEEGKRLFLEAAAIRERISGTENRDCIFSHVGAAFCLIEQEKWVEALPKLLWAQGKLSNVDDNRNITSALTAFGQGLLYRDSLSPKLAEGSFREAYRLVELELGPENIYTALARYELGVTLVMLGRDDEAMPHFDFAIKTAKNVMKLRHPRFRGLIQNYTKQLRRLGRNAEGEALWNDYLVAQKSRFGDNHRFVYEAMFSQADFLTWSGKRTEAKEIYLKLEQEVPKLDSRSLDWLLALTYCEHSSILCREKQFQEVERIANSAIAMFLANPKFKQTYLFEWTYVQCELGEAYLDLKKDGAAEQFEAALSVAKKLPPNERSFPTNYVKAKQTAMHLQNSNIEAAIGLCRERKALCRKHPQSMLELAYDWMKCIALFEESSDLAEEDKKALIEGYTGESVQVLKAVLDSGWKNHKAIETDKRFLRLREREDFQKLFQDEK